MLASLASTPQVPVQLPPTVVAIKNVSSHYQMYPGVGGFVEEAKLSFTPLRTIHLYENAIFIGGKWKSAISYDPT